MTARKPRPAQAGIVGREIVIRLPIAYIPEAIAGVIDWIGAPRDYPIRVTDASVFAKEVVAALNHEDEQGTTPIHTLFDEAFWTAAENGAQGVDVGEFKEDGTPVYPERKRSCRKRDGK